MLCQRCDSLEHWEKDCPHPFGYKPKQPRNKKPQERSESTHELVVGPQRNFDTKGAKYRAGPGRLTCPGCVVLEAEVLSLRAKYEMTAEEKLARIQGQRREASRRYREKQK